MTIGLTEVSKILASPSLRGLFRGTISLSGSHIAISKIVILAS